VIGAETILLFDGAGIIIIRNNIIINNSITIMKIPNYVYGSRYSLRM